MVAPKWGRKEEDWVVRVVAKCASVRQLKQILARVVTAGETQNCFVAAKLVRAFAEVGDLDHARAVTDGIHRPNAFVWTALIRAYSLSDDTNSCKEALLLYNQMKRSPEAMPLTFTLCSALKACARLMALREGTQIHSHVFKHGFKLDARVQTTLIGFYSKCKHLVQAEKVFDGMLKGGVKDVQAWNTMIAAYADAGDMGSAYSLLDTMPERNTITWVEMIGGYAAVGQMASARRIFESGLAAGERKPVVYTAMITGYAKSGEVSTARLVFDAMTERDVASWNAMITAYSNAGLIDDALDLFKLMLSTTGRGEAEPNRSTIATVVSVCASSGSPGLANWIQDYINRRGAALLNSHTVAALIDMHAKCGDLSRAYDLFRRWEPKDLICYSSMIAGFGMHGCGKDAIRVFDDLRRAGLKPDAICFVSVLAACSHAGMVGEGRRYFQSMREEHGLAPTADHYMCIVDLLGRAGRIGEAYKLITDDMPPGVRPHVGVWGALLSACRIHSDVEVGEAAARHLMELEPENAGNYVLLANIYAKARRWGSVAKVRALMRSRGMRKPPGCSWVEVERGVRRFLTGELYHERLEMVLEALAWELKDQGYSPSIGEVE